MPQKRSFYPFTKPLSEVEISVGNLKQFSDGNGMFMMADVPVTNNRTYPVCKKDGYFNAFQSLKTAATSEEWAFLPVLITG